MSHTLFDLDEPPEHRPTERRPHGTHRTAILPVRLTEAERDQLAEVVRDLGLSLSTYMRQVVLSRPLPPRRAVRPIPEVNRDTYHALGKLGVDLAAIARAWTEQRRMPDRAEVLEAVELLTRLLGTVRGEVLGTTLDPEGGQL
jgi:hypothetical protein